MQHNNDTSDTTRMVATRLQLGLDKRLAKLAIDLNVSKQSLIAEAVELFVGRKQQEFSVTGGKNGKATKF